MEPDVFRALLETARAVQLRADAAVFTAEAVRRESAEAVARSQGMRRRVGEERAARRKGLIPRTPER